MLSVAPMKALCSERYEDWNSRFSGLGLKCLELTGDSMMYDYSELQDVHIILTTPVSLSVRPSVRLSVCLSVARTTGSVSWVSSVWSSPVTP